MFTLICFQHLCPCLSRRTNCFTRAVGQEPVDCFCSWFLWWYSAFRETRVSGDRGASAAAVTWLLLWETSEELCRLCPRSWPAQMLQIQLAKSCQCKFDRHAAYEISSFLKSVFFFFFYSFDNAYWNMHSSKNDRISLWFMLQLYEALLLVCFLKINLEVLL